MVIKIFLEKLIEFGFRVIFFSWILLCFFPHCTLGLEPNRKLFLDQLN
jgi:hypothetical protein